MSTNPSAERIAADFEAWSRACPPESAALARAIDDGTRPCYVLGRNEHSRFMAARVPLAGVIDDAATPGQRWCDLPVVHGDSVPADACVISAVLHRRPHQARQRIRAMAQAPRELAYADLMRLDPARHAPLPFCAAARAAFTEHRQRFAEVASRLVDSTSHQVLRDIMLYRLTADADFTAGYSLRDDEQYFDVDMAFACPPRFVDGGAFRGETTEYFLRHHPHNCGAEVFEPNPASLALARQRLAGNRDIAFHPLALGDAAGSVGFDASAANASRVSDHGELRVQVAALDDVVREPVHFIKYDLEGYETRAIDGARATIERNHPHLAICVYHSVMDFIDVPRHVLAVRDDYDLLLRHYTQGWEETVMYFIPRRRT